MAFIKEVYTTDNIQDTCNHHLAKGMDPQIAMEDLIRHILHDPTMIPDPYVLKNSMDLLVAAGAVPKRATHILFDIKNESDESYTIRAMLIDHFGMNLNTSFIRYLTDWKSMDEMHPYWDLFCRSHYLQTMFPQFTSVHHTNPCNLNLCMTIIVFIMLLILILKFISIY